MEAGHGGVPVPRGNPLPPRPESASASVVTVDGQPARPDVDAGRLEVFIQTRLRESETVTHSMHDGSVVEQTAIAAGRMVDAIRRGGKLIFFGNGGSSMDAGHLAAELMGRFHRDRRALPAVSLSDATAAVTAIANDYGYDDVFARQLAGLGRPGDVAVGLTTSGNSVNVIRALAAARELGLYTVAMTGATGGQAAEVADVCILVPATDTPRVQEACLLLGHTLCEIVELELFGPA